MNAAFQVFTIICSFIPLYAGDPHGICKHFARMNMQNVHINIQITISPVWLFHERTANKFWWFFNSSNYKNSSLYNSYKQNVAFTDWSTLKKYINILMNDCLMKKWIGRFIFFKLNKAHFFWRRFSLKEEVENLISIAFYCGAMHTPRRNPLISPRNLERCFIIFRSQRGGAVCLAIKMKHVCQRVALHKWAPRKCRE